MKKLILIIFSIAFILTSCGTLQLADVGRLSPGMTISEVNYIMGNPIRTLSTSYSQDGRIDVYEYRTYRNESYAVEFLDGQFNRYDFMYEDIPPATVSPAPYPVYPVQPPVRPTPPPVRPTPPNNVRPPERPGSVRPPVQPTPPERPGNTGRPPTQHPSQPSQPERPSQPVRPTDPERPSQPEKPSQPSQPGRPSQPGSTGRPGSNTTTTRPTTRPANNTTQPATRPATTTGRQPAKTTEVTRGTTSSEKENRSRERGR